MRRTWIGDTPVSRLALGGASWSLADVPDVGGAIAAIHAALEHGVTLLDTARAYTTVDHLSHNESLIGKALAVHPEIDSVFVATKGGHYRSGPSEFPVDGSPAALGRDCEQSLRMLGRECLDLLQLHRADDPSTVIEESVAELAALRTEGKVRYIGLCNVTVEQLEKARTITPIDAVQNHYSPLVRDDETLAYCARTGIPYLAYSPLAGRSGANRVTELTAFRRVATDHGLTIPQVVIAWLTSLTVIPGRGHRPPRARDPAGRCSVRGADSSRAGFVVRGVAAGRLLRPEAQLNSM